MYVLCYKCVLKFNQTFPICIFVFQGVAVFGYVIDTTFWLVLSTVFGYNIFKINSRIDICFHPPKAG